MQIQHQNSFPPNYQNYPQQPPPGYYNPYNPYYQPQIPPNYQQPQQKGMFGNFGEIKTFLSEITFTSGLPLTITSAK